MTLECEIGNPTHTAWCSPCRGAGMCLKMKIPVGEVQYGTPQPFKGGNLTPAQQSVIDDLLRWKTPLMTGGTITTNHGLGEDAAAMFANVLTLRALWRGGWVVRSAVDPRARMFDKWMMTDAAWEHVVGGCREPPRHQCDRRCAWPPHPLTQP